MAKNEKMKTKKIIVIGLLLFSPVLIAGASLWFGHKSGLASLLITPRKYVPIAPNTNVLFTSVAYFGDGSVLNVTSNETTWSCSESIGFINDGNLTVTGAVNSFGLVIASYHDLVKTIYTKVTTSGKWNPDDDFDNDGISDKNELEILLLYTYLAGLKRERGFNGKQSPSTD